MKIRRATAEDTDTLMPLVRAYHEFEGIEATDEERLDTVRLDDAG